MTKDEALKLGLQVVEAAEYLANNPAIFGEYVQEKRALKRALIQRSKIAFEEALAQPEQESDDLTAAYLSGVYDGKNKYAPQSFTYEQVKAHIQAALMSSSMPQLQTFTGENPFSPQRKPLTDEQLIAAYESEQRGRYGDHIRSLRAIEAAHGIKE